jgi:hypothetical protein
MQRSERRRRKRQRELERQQRQREKEVRRYQKKRNRYGEEEVIRQAKNGVRSFLLAAAATALLGMLVMISYRKEGNAAAIIGAMGICDWVLSGAGIFVGIIGLRERDRKYLTCRLGIGWNAVLFVGLAIIFFRGI